MRVPLRPLLYCVLCQGWRRHLWVKQASHVASGRVCWRQIYACHGCGNERLYGLHTERALMPGGTVQ